MLDHDIDGDDTSGGEPAASTTTAPARPRRRRAATSEAGPPGDAAQQAAPAVEPAAATAPRRTRAPRRTATAAAGAPSVSSSEVPPAEATLTGDPDAAPGINATSTSALGAADAGANAVEVSDASAGQSKTPPPATRRRARRTSSTPVSAPASITDEVPGGDGALAGVSVPPVDPAADAPARPRRTRTRPKAAAPAVSDRFAADADATPLPGVDTDVALAAVAPAVPLSTEAATGAKDKSATELELTAEDDAAGIAAVPGAPSADFSAPEAATLAEPATRTRTRRRSSSMAVTFQPPAEPEPLPVVPDQVQGEEPMRPARRGRRTAAQRRAEEAALADEATVAAASAAFAEAAETATPASSEDGVVGDGDVADGEADDDEDRPSRRRRRGRRGRGRARNEGDPDDAEVSGDSPDADADADEAAPAAEVASDTEETDGDETTSTTRRRRRRRRGGSGADSEVSTAEDPPDTVVKVREPRQPRRRGGQTEADEDGVRGITGSTRMAAKRARRQEGRETGRKRPPVISESEFLARREAVERVMLVRQTGERTQVAVLEDDILVEHYVTKASASSYAGNIYLGRVQNVLPSMEAAFLDIGKGRNGVLYAGEVNYDSSQFAGKPRSIEAALKSGQQVLVQVTKDPIGSKGARLTSQISLPGRYVVYVPEGSMTGISRKLPENERKRLKDILRAVVPDDAGVIVRTAAEGASEDELIRDVERLQSQWQQIQAAADKAAKSSAPVLLHAEPDLVVRVVRDVFNEDFVRLVVQGDSEWEVIRSYVDSVAPDLSVRMSHHTGERDLFATHRVDEQLAKALDRKVWLPSGGSLVIDRTEAMVVVDVNTGRFVGKGGNLEETVTRNNLEAAEEVVRQLRLRDLGGIIVVDFIDMVLESNRDLVMRRLTECLGRDRTKHQVAEVTSLGLVQMTRKRVGQGLLEAFSETCEVCGGRGVLVHSEPVDAPEPLEQASSDPGGNGRAGSGERGNSSDRPDEGSGAGRRGRRRAGTGSTITPLPVEDVRSPDGGAALAAVALAAARARQGVAPDPKGPEELASEDQPTIVVGGAVAPADPSDLPQPTEPVQPPTSAAQDEPAALPAGGRRRRRGSAVRPAGPPVPVS